MSEKTSGAGSRPTAEGPTGPAPQGAPPDEAPTGGGSASSGSAPTDEPSTSDPGEVWASLAPDAADGREAGGEAGESALDDEVAEAEQQVLDDLARLTAERDDYLDQLLRVKADFENYRKRILRQQTEHLERAAEDLVTKLLDVLDTFDMALGHGKGFEQVHQALMATLQKEGLERIDPRDEPFDPNEADAVAHDDGDDGPVVSEVLRPGYRWKGRVLRPAMVKVRG